MQAFAIDAATDALRARVAAFVRERIVPLEALHANDDGHGSRLKITEAD